MRMELAAAHSTERTKCQAREASAMAAARLGKMFGTYSQRRRHVPPKASSDNGDGAVYFRQAAARASVLQTCTLPQRVSIYVKLWRYTDTNASRMWQETSPNHNGSRGEPNLLGHAERLNMERYGRRASEHASRTSQARSHSTGHTLRQRARARYYT